MLVDINRYDVARPQPIRVVKAAVDRFDLCLDRGFFSRAHRLARTERARGGKQSLAALLAPPAEKIISAFSVKLRILFAITFLISLLLRQGFSLLSSAAAE